MYIYINLILPFIYCLGENLNDPILADFYDLIQVVGLCNFSDFLKLKN